MEAKHEPESNAALPAKGSASVAQAVVDLISASHCGLVFWSRHPFEIASELQVRLRTSALAQASLQLALQARGGWVVLSGFVVDCQPARRDDGTVGFQVSLLFQSAVCPSQKKKERESLGNAPWTPGMISRLFGRN